MDAIEPLRRLVTGSLFYLRIDAERVWLRDPSTGRELTEAAAVAVAPDVSATRVGDAALGAPAGWQILRPFAHPRVAVDGFDAAQRLLDALLRRMRGHALLARKPVVVLHPLRGFDGGLADIERRALQELALAAGAGQVRLWVGRVLGDAELLEPLQQGREG